MMINSAIIRFRRSFILFAVSSGIFFWFFAYDLIRTDYIKLVLVYGVLFFCFYKLVQQLKNNTNILTWFAFVFRGIFILAIPNLSQDFYRFIWDGRMILEGFNPYLHTVESFISNAQYPIAQAQELYEGMGKLNASHYSNYPPLNQLCFVIGGLFASQSILGSVTIMRLLIIAADFGTLYFGKKLLKSLNIPIHHIFWYILNPFIIIELTGNLHFEGVMIFFLVWSLYLLKRSKCFWAAVIFGLSVSVKLIPLIFLPLFFQWFMKNKGSTFGKIATSFHPYSNWNEIARNDVKKNFGNLLLFYVTVIGTTIVLFLPFYSSEFINNYVNTAALWFQNFEFNASFYYLAREIGYSFRGYNEIKIIGKYIPIIVILFTLIIAFLKKITSMTQLITAMLFVLSFYYFTATVVHPWYIGTLLILCVFTKYKFPLVWSAVIILSYLSYLNINSMDKSENLRIIALEYFIVYGFLIWELFIKKAPKKEAL